MTTPKKELTNHTVIIGWDRFAGFVTDHLLSANQTVCIISNNHGKVEQIEETYYDKSVITLCTPYNNFEKVRELEVEQASIVLINIEEDTKKLIYILNLRKHFPDVRIVAPIQNANLKDTFINAGVVYPLSNEEISAKLFASYLFEKDVAIFLNDILTFASDEEENDIQQYQVTKDNPFLDHTYFDAFVELRKNYNAILIGISKTEGDKRRLLKNPPNETPIRLGDYLIIIINHRTMNKIRESFGSEEGRFSD